MKIERKADVQGIPTEDEKALNFGGYIGLLKSRNECCTFSELHIWRCALRAFLIFERIPSVVNF